MLKRIFYSLLFLVNNALNGQSTFDQKLKTLYTGSVPVVTTDSLATWISEQKPGLLILDTREQKEYKISHIDGAELLPFEAFKTSKKFSIPDSITTVVVYCSVGYRSERVGETLLKNNTIEVYNLYGGIFQWVNEGQEVVDKKGITNQVHTYNKEWSKWLIKGKKVYE